MKDKTTVIEARDCEGGLMFVIHELAGVKAPLEVYDKENNLLAKGASYWKWLSSGLPSFTCTA